MDAELKALCKQTVTRLKFVSYDDHNDFTWTNEVTNQNVVLTGVAASLVLDPTGGQTILAGMVVTDATDETTYVLNDDYTIDYVTGKIARTADSTILIGATVHVSYSWQTISTFLARVEYDNIVLREQNGQQFVSTCQIYTEQIDDLNERDKLTLPTGTLVSQPEIKHIAHNPDEDGNIDHIVIYVG